MQKILLLIIFLGFYSVSLAQEICGNGLDDDNNGKVDCFDPACANKPECDGSFIGQDKDCQVEPPAALTFQMDLAHRSSQSNPVTTSFDRIVVGDLDGDGYPEVVTPNYNNKKVYILDGRDLTTKKEISPKYNVERYDLAIGDVNGDGCGEIFIATKNSGNGRYYIEAYNCEGNPLAAWGTTHYKQTYGRPYDLGLADFDQDGKVELYYRNEIMAAETGTILIAGSGTWTDEIDAGPVAADVLPVTATMDNNSACTDCDGLELVAGGLVYAIKITNRNGTAGNSRTLARSINTLITGAANKYFPFRVDCCGESGLINSQTSIADFNQDGNLDILMTGATGANKYTATRINGTNPREYNQSGEPTVFYWDIIGKKYFTYKPKQPTVVSPPSSYTNKYGLSWDKGMGRINVANLDNDDLLEITFVSGNQLYALSPDAGYTTFVEKWKRTIDEESSGFTSTTVFDFNNDNAAEIVYRDESKLYIIKGTDGSDYTWITCHSQTTNEYPVVVDVDNDGATEICITCALNDNPANVMTRGEVRMYKSAYLDDPWVPARKVWNQHGYFNVNINDDLTIPQVQQKHHIVFEGGTCMTGENRALNSFLNQSAILDSKGCKTYPAPDIIFEPDPVSLINITPPTCPETDFKVSFKLRNQGNLAMNGTLPIAFYSGDPRVAGAQKIDTLHVILKNLEPGQTKSVVNATISGTGKNFTLFAVLNDDGTTALPFASGVYPNSAFNECTYSNNVISAAVNPNTFPLTLASADHFQCGTDLITGNGYAEAYKLEGGVKVTAGFTFYWFNSQTVGDTINAVYEGPVRNQLLNGEYSVIAYHNNYRCASAPSSVTIGLQEREISAVVTALHDFTNCVSPDGMLKVTPSPGQPEDYSYQWFVGTVFGTSPILSVDDTLSTAEGFTYSVLVREEATNCETIVPGTVVNNTIRPAISATSSPADCVPAESGSATANSGGTTAGYTFLWYDGETILPSANFTGITYDNLTAGSYTVVARSNATGCKSDPFIVTVGSPTGFSVTATRTAQQTSCAAPNGAASASIGGTTAGYTFKWFSGNNTLPANQLPQTTPTITGLAAGTYTVEVTRGDGCTDTDIVVIEDQILDPTVTASVVSQQTFCSPFNGAVSASTASPGTHDFYWFNGSAASDTTLANHKGATYSGRAAGNYTVVAVNRNTRCFSDPATVTVIDQTQNPVITPSIVNHTNCDPAFPNGSASAAVNSPAGTYKFRWFTGADTTSFISQGTSITGRAAGTFTVKAVNLTTGCFSTSPVSIVNNFANPTVAATSTINNMNCSGATPNGSIVVEISGGTNPVTDYTIQWFEGNGTTTALGTTTGSTGGTNNEIAEELIGGTYTVKVTDNVSPGRGCTVTSSFSIINNPPTISISNANISVNASTNCSPGNGTATVTVVTPGALSDYTFTWLESDGVTPITSAGSSNSISALASGNYFVRATSNNNNCTSAVTSFTIDDNHVNPAITALTLTNNLNCSGATNPSGQITINVDGSAPASGQFQVEWFSGNGTTTPLAASKVAGSNNETARLLGAGSYTVRVTDLSTPNRGCVTVQTFTIIDDPVTISIANADIDITDNTNCSPGNGSAEVTAITGPGTIADYTFEWLQSDGVTAINNAGSGSVLALAAQVVGGSYFVRATNNTTQCSSVLTPFTIGDNNPNPVITSATLANNENCSGATNPSGQITINVDGSAPVSGQFQVEWFSGNGITTPLATTKINGSNNETARFLGAGSYTVRVTDTSSPRLNCVTVQTFTIIDNPAMISIANADIDITDNTNCSPGNGSAEVTALTGPGAIADYTFEWLQSDGVTAINNAGSGSVLALAAQVVGGSYFVRATNNTTQCSSVLTPFTIGDNNPNPVITSATLANNENCSGATNPSGQITINVDGSAPVSGQFQVEWFSGNGITTPLAATKINGSNNETARFLGAGSYTVRVTDTSSPRLNCVTVQTFTIIDNPAMISIANADIDITDNTNCSPGNGSAEITALTGPGAIADYTFEWLQSDGVTLITNAGNGAVLALAAEVMGGSYFVRATNTTTACASVLTPFTINDAPVVPVITEANNDDNTICDIVNINPDGSLTIGINGGADPSEFMVEWFRGNSTAVALNAPAITSGVNNEIVNRLSAGKYTVRVTDNIAPALGCITTQTFTIVDNLTLPTPLNTTPFDNTACDPVKSNGRIQASVGGATTGLQFDFFKGQNTLAANLAGTPVVTATEATLNNLVASIYTVRSTIAATGCFSTAEVTVGNNIVLPTLAVNPQDVTMCTDPANGEVTATIANGIGVISDYTFTWYIGKQVLAASSFAVTGNVLDNSAGDNITAGFYTVFAHNNTLGCDAQAPVTAEVNFDPSVAISIAELPAPERIIPSDCTDSGAMAVEVSSPSNAGGGFTFEWFTGDKHIGMNPIGNGQSFATDRNRINQLISGINIISGMYTVIALDNTTGCQDSLAIHLPYSTQAALIHITTTDQTHCSNPDGSFTATITPDPATELAVSPLVIDQTWYEIRVYQNGSEIVGLRTSGTMPSTTVGGPGAGLSAGTYTVIAYETHAALLPGCPTEPNTVTINDLTDHPDILADQVDPNNHCVGATGNGEIVLSVDGSVTPAGGYSYSWFTGQIVGTSPLPPANFPAGHTALNLTGGFYTVEVTNTTNDCKSAETFTLTNEPYTVTTIPVLAHQTDCSPFDGSAEVNVVLLDGVNPGAPITDYDFTWYEADGTTTFGGALSTVGTLAAGKYFVKVEDNTTTNCESDLIAFEILDQTPEITIDFASTPNRICNPAGAINPDGAASIEIFANAVGENEAEYTITWTTLNAQALLSLNDDAASQVLEGIYNVHVVKTLAGSVGEGCEAEVDIEVKADKPLIAVNTFALTHDTNCLPVGNGTVEVTDVLVRNVSSPLTDFTFTWKQNNGTTIGASGNLAVMAGMLNHNASPYFVSVLHGPSNCVSPNAPFVILDKHVDPTLTATTTPNQMCDAGAVLPDGSAAIQILANGAGETESDYTITWTTLNAGAVLAADDASATNVDDGTYHVHVIKDRVANTVAGAGCETELNVTVIPDKPLIAVNTFALTHDTNCLPVGNGAAEVTDVLVRNVSSPLTDFTFTWKQNNGTTIGASGNVAVMAGMLNHNTSPYFVSVLHGPSNCVSPNAPFVILDKHVDPTLTVTTTPNQMCDAGAVLPDGTAAIQILANGTGETESDYTITWTTLNAGAVLAADDASATNVDDGTYHVHVIKDRVANTVAGAGCETELNVTVTPDKPLIAVNTFALTHDTNCLPVGNGTAEVTDVLVRNLSSPLTDFTFTWKQNNGTTIGASGNLAVMSGMLNHNASPYFVSVLHGPSNCVSPNAPFVILDKHVDPTLTATTTPNQMCDAGAVLPDGSAAIQILANGAGETESEYTITWTTLNADAVLSADNASATVVDDGTYHVHVIKDQVPNSVAGAGCEAELNVTVLPDKPVIAISQINLTHDRNCGVLVSGSAEVTELLVRNISTTSVGDFVFTWQNNTLGGAGNNSLIGVALDDGDYVVNALHSASNCVSPDMPFTILDNSIAPALDATITTNTICYDATHAPNGQISLQLRAGSVIESATDYTITWAGIPIPVIYSADNAVATQVTEGGPYHVHAIKTAAGSVGEGCEVDLDITVDHNKPLIAIDRMSLTPDTDCAPFSNGAATVTRLLVNNDNSQPVNAFNYVWQNNTIGSTGNTETIQVPLTEGNYVVRALHIASNCESFDTPFLIEDRAVIPAISIVETMPNIACNTSYTGAIAASVTEGTTPGVTTNYSFEWFAGNNTSGVSIGGTPTLSGLQEGAYTVRVRDTASPNRNCDNTATLAIRFAPTNFASEIVSVDQASCAPLQDGSLTVNTITETVNGVTTPYNMTNAANRALFSFQWFDENPAALTGIVNGQHNLTGQLAGQYYVQITNGLGCTSTLSSGVIADETVAPIITLEDFANPTVCVLPETPGRLVVSANNDLMNSSDYTFEWFEGANTSGSLVESNQQLAGIMYNQPMEYTVRVTTIATNCFSTKTFTLATDTIAIRAMASAQPLTNCVVNNGQLFAAVQQGAGPLYNFEWYAGTVDATPEFTTKEVATAPLGKFIVIARHPSLTFCPSIPDTTVVQDGRMYPDVDIEIKHALTYCDPANPNGVAKATVNGEVIGYTFDWYRGNVAGTPFYVGSEVSGLHAELYTVNVVNAVSGCATAEPVNVPNDPVKVAMPTVFVESHRTDCEIPDGALVASVNGTLINYTIQWYDGSSVRNQTDAQGEFYRDLAEGMYTTTATDVISGCVSDPVITEVLPMMVYPEFNVETTPTHCDADVGEAFYVALNDVPLRAVEWMYKDFGSVIWNGVRISSMAKGEYTVIASTDKNCVTAKDFWIKPDVLVYNGVSPNNDGNNDIFEISCIQDFENNVVKIFNRAGTLVYQARGYNNTDIYFDGRSNEGISLLGKDLPDGTYFYIIDKNDGSVPKTGYLELLRQ